MKIIGLCGGSGSGKGEVARIFSASGFLHIDADSVYHRLISGDSECLRALAAEFGDGIISPSGALDRSQLASIVFAPGAEDKLRMLNSISHSYILTEIDREIALAEGKVPGVLVDAPLLFESGLNTRCDTVVAVIAPKEVRIPRIIARDGITREQAERRINAQIADETLRERSDIIIMNNSDLDALKAQVKKIINKILEA